MSTESNVNHVRYYIQQKLADEIWHPTKMDAGQIVTDRDHFPYTRFYRGVYNSDKPIIMEREAGWRPKYNNCYKKYCVQDDTNYPNHCFSAPCSTVFPCYPKYQSQYADKEALDIQINRACISQYR